MRVRVHWHRAHISANSIVIRSARLLQQADEVLQQPLVAGELEPEAAAEPQVVASARRSGVMPHRHLATVAPAA